MKNKTITLIALLVLALAFSSAPAFAQTTTYQTITSAALNSTQTCFIVASTTSMSASGALTGPGGTPQEWDMFVDGEFMKINTVNTTSNQVCVQRGKSPTRAGAHATASIVFYGPAGLVPFIVGPPLTTTPGPATPGGAFGSCVSTQFQFLPLINVADGSIWNCLTTGRGAQWVSYNFRQWTSGHPVVNIIDLAYTATLADEFIDYTSLTATRILTLPAITGVRGKTMVVLNDATGTSAITITPSANQTIGAGAATTISSTNAGTVTRLISRISSTGAWGWATW